MRVTELLIYPIKSCQGIALTTAEVTPKGLAWDREMMLVDSQGMFMTQRQFPQLATVSLKIAQDCFVLCAPTQPDITLSPTLSGSQIEVEVWGDRAVAIDQGDAIAHWLASVLQLASPQACRLVRQSPQYPRPIDPNYRLQDNDSVSFSDGFPLLLTNNASLGQLNHKLAEIYPDHTVEIPMDRFRPNVVIDGDRSFAEDDWLEIAIGEVRFVAVKPCSRCIITTTDQKTGERQQQEPLRTLRTFRQKDQGKIMFGENLIPQSLGSIGIGDRVQVRSLKSGVTPF
jgi:hypothetical protein